LALRMLSLWPLLPLLWLARASGQGQRLYDFLASRRLIVPDARWSAACPARCPAARTTPERRRTTTWWASRRRRPAPSLR
ncbi:hypothetical protein, partial [Pyxidicoccus fallax]|uniref:hypothetical protein n=1 Tax=Pyxidicoccus fallax TaxID=394095 RepID=UPI001B7D72EA